LNAASYRVTRVATEGGWLRRENTTLLIGVEDNRVEHALRTLKRAAGKRSETRYISGDVANGIPPQMVEEEVGGVTVFVVDAEHFEQM